MVSFESAKVYPFDIIDNALEDALEEFIKFLMNPSSLLMSKYSFKNGFKHLAAAKMIGSRGFLMFCSIKSYIKIKLLGKLRYPYPPTQSCIWQNTKEALMYKF